MLLTCTRNISTLGDLGMDITRRVGKQLPRMREIKCSCFRHTNDSGAFLFRDEGNGASQPVRLFWITAWTLLWKSLRITYPLRKSAIFDISVVILIFSCGDFPFTAALLTLIS